MVSEEAYAAVVAENQHLSTQLATALERIAELEAQVAALTAKKTPPPGFVKANRPVRAAKERTKRAAQANHARRRETPTRTVAHAITHCPDCGGALGGVRVGRRRQVIELPPPPPVELIEHQVQRGWCSACGKWREAPLDLGGHALGRGRVGVGIAALVAHLRISLRLPIRLIQSYLDTVHGLRVSSGELVALLQRVAAHAAPTVAAIRARVRGRRVVHGDETGWREQGQNGYTWVLASAEGERYFEYHRSRAGAVVNQMLGEEFTGVLVSDFYAGYNDTPGGRHQRCWVHLGRDLHQLREAYAGDLSRQGLEVRAWVDAVQALADQVRTASTSPPDDPAVRATTEQALLEELRLLSELFVDQSAHPCHTLARRLWHFQGELLTCVRRPEVPADNNAAERAIRPLVVTRKISGGTRSPRGSATHMALATLAHTWTASGLAPLNEFRRLLQSPLPQV